MTTNSSLGLPGVRPSARTLLTTLGLLSTFGVLGVSEGVELIVDLEEGDKVCFFETVKSAGEAVKFMYQVIRGGNMDVSVWILDPNHRTLHTKEKEKEGEWSGSANMAGDYQFCFDNGFSSFTNKVIYFEIEIGSDSDDPNSPLEPTNKTQAIRETRKQMTAVEERLDVIKKNMQYSQVVMRGAKMRESQRRSRIEDLFVNVNVASVVVVSGVLISGAVSVTGVRRLFK